jgi:hypothetical protein
MKSRHERSEVIFLGCGLTVFGHGLGMIHSELVKLLRLQERDLALLQVLKQMREIPAKIAGCQQKLEGDQKALVLAQQAVTEVELRIKQIELDIGTRRTSIQRLQQQQFETRKNEEFQTMGLEIKRYEGMVAELEDQQLAEMLILDERKAQVQVARGVLTASETLVNEEISEWQRRLKGLEKSKQELEVEVTTLEEPVEGEVLALYKRILTKKGTAAVVPVEHGVCGGCHMKITISSLQVLAKGEQIEHCESCGRMIYMA